VPHKLLIADDSAAIQQVIRLAFDGEPIDVVAADDGAAAIDAVTRESPDIVLVDASLPGTDGYDLAGRLRHDAAHAAVPVVLLTGAFEPVDRARADAVGCRDVLVKPFAPGDVVARVLSLLGLEAASVPETTPATDAPAAIAPEPIAVVEPPEPVAPAPAAPEPVAAVEPPEPVVPEPVAAVEPPEPVVPEPVAAVEPPEPVVPEPVAAVEPPEPVVPEPVAPERAAAAETRPAVPPPQPRDPGGAVLARAFRAFLAAEQRHAPPPALTETVKAELIERVRDRLTASFVREVADDAVERAADRLLREELASLAAEASRLRRGAD
jgi:CheY-like chemotaxis protein